MQLKCWTKALNKYFTEGATQALAVSLCLKRHPLFLRHQLRPPLQAFAETLPSQRGLP